MGQWNINQEWSHIYSTRWILVTIIFAYIVASYQLGICLQPDDESKCSPEMGVVLLYLSIQYTGMLTIFTFSLPLETPTMEFHITLKVGKGRKNHAPFQRRHTKKKKHLLFLQKYWWDSYFFSVKEVTLVSHCQRSKF